MPDALLHAARNLVRVLVLGVREPDEREHLVRAALQIGPGLARAEHALDGEVDVVEAREPRQQRVVLEDHAALRTRPRDLPAGAKQNAAARGKQAGHQVEQRRFAAPRVADQRHELAAREW